VRKVRMVFMLMIELGEPTTKEVGFKLAFSSYMICQVTSTLKNIPT